MKIMVIINKHLLQFFYIEIFNIHLWYLLINIYYDCLLYRTIYYCKKFCKIVCISNIILYSII